MMTNDDPAAIAEYDQALATSTEYLNKLVDTFLVQRDHNAEDGWSEVMTVVAMSVWLNNELPREVLSSALAAAVLVLARNRG
jgi:hypothetical protein